MKTLSAFLCVAIPKLVAGGGQFVLTLFLIRRFEPAEFGALAVCLSIILVCDSFLGSAVDLAIVRLAPQHQSSGHSLRALQVQNAGLLFKPLAIGVIAIPVTVFSQLLSLALFQRRDFADLILSTLLALTAMLLLRSVQTYFQVSHLFTWYGGADFAHNLLRYGTVWFALTAGFATPRLVLTAYAIAPAIVALALLLGPARKMIQISPRWDTARELGCVLAWFIPTAAVGGLTSRMDVFFVSHLGGVREAGIFTAAQAVGMPVLLLGTYLAVVFGPRIMPQFSAGTLRAFYRQFQFSIAALAMGVYLFLLAGKVWFSALLFPGKFLPSAAVLVVLFPSLLAGLINFPLTISLLLFLKPKFIFAVDAFAIPLLCASYCWVIPKFGALGAAAVTTTYSMVKLGILQITAWRLLAGENPANNGAQRLLPLRYSEGF